MPWPWPGARKGDFHFISSRICAPTVNSGLKEPKGSCGMNVMRRPRTSCAMRRCGMAKRSSPANQMLPVSALAFPARMPRMVLASVVLPQPDSPTRPMISPARIVRLTPSSTLAAPASVAKVTQRWSTSRSLSPGVATSDPWVKHVAQAIAQKIEAHHDQEDGKARRQRGPPGLGQELAGFGDHAAPLRRRRRGAEPKEAERARSENGKAHADGGAHDDGGEDAGQHVQQHDAPGRHAKCDRGLDKGLVPQ